MQHKVNQPTLEAEKRIPEEGWQLTAQDRQTFAKLFSEYMRQAGLSRVEMARRLTESPFNRDGEGKIHVSQKSNERKVTRWANGDDITKDRALVFQVCILLGLDTERARRLFEKGLQWGWIYAGSREELIYGFCISCGLGIDAAHQMIEASDQAPAEELQSFLQEEERSFTVPQLTKSIYDGYERLLTGLTADMTQAEKQAAFGRFLWERREDFHRCSASRREAFMELYTPYMEELLIRETVTAYGEIKQTTYTRSITDMADDLRLMWLPDPEAVEELDKADPDPDAIAALIKMLDDDKLGDSNPIRKDITNYIRGSKEVPRELLIKTYILVSEGQPTSLYDLNALLTKAGYPPIYVRGATGLDALVYDLLREPADESTAYAELQFAVFGQRQYVADRLGRTDRLQAAAQAKADRRAAAEQEIRELREVQEAEEKKGQKKGFFHLWRR